MNVHPGPPVFYAMTSSNTSIHQPLVATLRPTSLTRSNNRDYRDKVSQPAKYASKVIVAIPSYIENSATDWGTGQAADPGNRKDGPYPVADFAHGRDAYDEDGSETDVGAGIDAEEDG